MIMTLGWDFGTSFFHAAQTFLNVGFGVPIESSDGSWFFSTFYIILGSILLAAFMAQLFQDMLTDNAKHLFDNHLVTDSNGHIIVFMQESKKLRAFDFVILALSIFILVGTLCAYYLEDFDPIEAVSIYDFVIGPK